MLVRRSQDETARTEVQSLVDTVSENHDGDVSDYLHLHELVQAVRAKFSVPPDFTNDAILDDLCDIAAVEDVRQRWRIAFSSDLGKLIASSGRDLNTALNLLLGLIPRKAS